MINTVFTSDNTFYAVFEHSYVFVFYLNMEKFPGYINLLIN